MTLRSKLLIAQAPLIAGLVLIGVLGSVTTSSLGRGAQTILRDNYRSVLAAQRMKESLERIDSGVFFFVVGERERGLTQLGQHRQLFESELAVQEGNITEPGEHEATVRLRMAWSEYKAQLDLLAGGEVPDPKKYYFEDLLPKFLVLKDAADVILALNQDAMVRKSEATRAAAGRLNTLILVLAGSASVLAFLLSFVLTARLLRPLNVLGHAARRIGEGDLAARALIAGEDEIAALARDFNAMADHLDRYRKSSLGELLEAQQISQAAIDSLPDPVLVLGLDGGLLHTNQAAETLLKLDLERGGSAALSALDPESRAVVERVREHVLGGRGVYAPRGLDEAFRMTTADGERHFLPRATPLYDESGAVRGATVVLQDVTRLLRFDELKNNLVATVAHEFRTPLTSLRMAIHLCTEEVVGPLTAKQADLLHAAREDCERLQGIVDELLDLSRIQAGRVELRTSELEIEATVDAALDAQRSVADSRGVALRSEVLPQSGVVQADPDRLQLVFSNLLANAIRHTPSGGTVVVRATHEPGRVRFEVEDQGRGVPKEYQQAVFEKFFRTPGAPEGGAGLGLFIARELVQAHDGSIGVVSDGVRGSTFWFTLPTAAADSAADASV